MSFLTFTLSILLSLSSIRSLIFFLSLHVIDLLKPLGFCLSGCLLTWSKPHLSTVLLDHLLTGPWIPLTQLSAGQASAPDGPLPCFSLSLGEHLSSKLYDTRESRWGPAHLNVVLRLNNMIFFFKKDLFSRFYLLLQIWEVVIYPVI